MTVVDEATLVEALSDPARRAQEYQRLVPAYYERVTASYRATWGDSFHFGLFSGGESRSEAIIGTELRLAQQGGLARDMWALDVGCGIGGPALNIARATGANVTGIDIVPHHVEIARERAAQARLVDRVTFVQADAQDLPFADGSFDCVYVLEAGCYMPDPSRYFAECARVLRAGGSFVGIDWGASGDQSPTHAAVLEVVCRTHAIPKLLDAGALRRHLKASGFEVQELGEVSHPHQVVRNQAKLRVVPPGGLDQCAGATAAALLAEGGRALGTAARLGCFVLIGWRATRG